MVKENIGSFVAAVIVSRAADFNYTITVETSDGTAVGKQGSLRSMQSCACTPKLHPTSHVYNLNINNRSLILYIHQQLAFTNPSFFSQGGDDFVSQQYQLDFPAGQTRAEFTVVITDDSLIEGTESFQLLLSIPEDLTSKGVQVGPNSAATVTIMDNDGEVVYSNCVHVCWNHIQQVRHFTT